MSLHRKWLRAKELSIPLTWNSNESRERVRPAGCNKFLLLLNPPAGHPRIYRRRGTISRRLDYCRNTSDRLPTKLFFYSNEIKIRKLQAVLKIRDKIPPPPPARFAYKNICQGIASCIVKKKNKSSLESRVILIFVFLFLSLRDI